VRLIRYAPFDQVDPDAMLGLLNDDVVRRHLIAHPRFTAASIRDWIHSKRIIDTKTDCRVRAVYIEDQLAGWCAIQPDPQGVELAIVISPRFWGAGGRIFKALLTWAKALGHNEVRFHLLDSRKPYRALIKRASRVETSEWSGRSFTTYILPL